MCSGNDGVVLTQAVFVRPVAAGEADLYAFTAGAATGIAGAIAAYTGVDAAAPVLAAAGQIRRNSKLATAPSTTPSVPGALLVAAFAHSGRSALTAPDGMTGRAAAAATPDVRFLVGDEPLPAAGPTGERTASSTTTNACAVGQSVALRPAPEPPVSTTAPTVSGLAQEGELLSATTGSWTWAPTSFAFRWQRSAGNGWLDVAGADTSQYRLGADDVGQRVRVVVTAANAGGEGTAVSDATAPVLPAPPAAASPPSVGGVAREQETLTADPGTWTGSPTFAFEWQRSADGEAWESVGTGAERVLGPQDVDTLLRVVVTATNAGGSASATSAPVGPVESAAPPTVLQPPTISGWQQEGQTLAAATGTWSGAPTAFAFRWERSADGVDWLELGTDAAAYTLTAADVGALVRVVVTASNTAGSAAAASDPVGPISPVLAPTNLERPAILSAPGYDVPVATSPGTWGNAPESFSYRWLRSADGGAGWEPIEGATGSTYVPRLEDVGLRLAFEVTASNAGGSTTAVSRASDPVAPPPPESVAAPQLSGEAVEGSTVTATPGEWTNSPDDFAYAWERCDEAGCTEIRWETDPTYVLRDDDVGRTVRAVVTASNPSGAGTSASAPTAIVLPLPPRNATPPALAGVAAQGETLTASTGAWLSATAIAFTTRWQRSGDGGDSWADLPGAVTASYLLTAEDVGAIVRAVVTATNEGGSAEAASGPTDVVALPGAPTVVAQPVISGVIQERGRLNALAGTWSGSPTFTYAWQRSSDGGATWANVPRGTTSRYTAVAADVGRLLRVLVTARNEYGSLAVATGAWPIHPAGGGQLHLVNSTWFCDAPVDVDLVRVTIVDGQLRDAIRFDNCSGRIGRVEIETNGIDGLKVRNTEPVAHDLTIGGGYVRCTGHPEGAHQDGIQVLGGTRLTFRNLVIWCGDPTDAFGSGVNSSALIAQGGAAAATTPTDVVIERSVMGAGTANGVLVEGSLRSGIRGSVACPDFTAAGGPVLIGAAAVDGIDVDNEKPGLDDPRCASFEAALAWVQAPG